LNSRRDVLEAERAGLLSQTRGPAEVLTAKEVVRYVKNLDGVLDRNTIAEQKALLQSFVDKVEVDWPSVEITYWLPVPASTPGGGGNGGGVGVLPSFQPGPPFVLEAATPIEVVDVTGCGSSAGHRVPRTTPDGNGLSDDLRGQNQRAVRLAGRLERSGAMRRVGRFTCNAHHFL